MPLKRKTFNEFDPGGSSLLAKRRNTLPNETKTAEHASFRRSRRLLKGGVPDEDIFKEDGEKDRYLITYADLMTLLLGLFILLYAISSVDVGKYEKVARAAGTVFGSGKELIGIRIDPKLAPATSLRRQMEDEIKRANIGSSVRISENERGLTLRILDDILFSSGQVSLRPQALGILHSVALMMKKLPNDIRIEGHTDNMPIANSQYPSNWHLSVGRATETAYFLMNHEGLNPERVSVVGYSEYKPLASNNKPEGRALNRRVDIVILK